MSGRVVLGWDVWLWLWFIMAMAFVAVVLGAKAIVKVADSRFYYISLFE